VEHNQRLASSARRNSEQSICQFKPIRVYYIAIKAHLGSNDMSSKKASFESRDPSYHSPDSANDRSTELDDAVDSGSDTAGTIDWETADEPVPAEGLIAPDKPFTLDEDASDKGSFYARDIESSDDSKTQAEKENAYNGIERRRVNRRSRQDRRSDIRFELDKNDRRQHSGRRESDFSPTYW